jgi:hypothetical protein
MVAHQLEGWVIPSLQMNTRKTSNLPTFSKGEKKKE